MKKIPPQDEAIEKMSDEEFIGACRYAIAAVQGNKIMHLCCYINKPGEEHFAGLDEELQTDEEFGLVGEEYELMLLPDWLFEKIMREEQLRRN